MTVKDIIADTLKSHGFDGLCHPDTYCCCGLDDLIGRCKGSRQDCRPAYRIRDPEGDPCYTLAFDHRPTEEEVREYWKKKRDEQWPAIPFLRDAPGPEVQRRARGPQESRGRARKAQAEKKEPEMTRRAGGVLGMMALSALVAGCHSGVPTDKVAALVAEDTHGAATVRRIFDGPSGLTGAVIAGGDNSPVVVWITADWKSLIYGNVFDDRARNLTELAALRQAGAPARTVFPASAPAPSPAPMEVSGPPPPVALAPGAYKTMADGVRFLRAGTGTRTLWIFLDPDCIWCHRLYADLGARPLPADVAVNWVPVGILKPSSRGRAETLLARGLPALSEDESRFDPRTEEGGVPETDNPDLSAEVEENNRIFRALGARMTPTVVFRDGSGRVLRFDGYPPPEVLDRIAGAAK